MKRKLLLAVGLFLVFSAIDFLARDRSQAPESTTETQTDATVDIPESIETVPTTISVVEETATIQKEEIIEVNEYELYLLSHLINGEAGADYCPDIMRYYVGSVVLNRVASDEFPDTIEEVIYQEEQYACTWDGNFNLEPSESSIEIARDLLINGSCLPGNVVFQAEFLQGDGVYEKIDNMYFCYINEEVKNDKNK